MLVGWTLVPHDKEFTQTGQWNACVNGCHAPPPPPPLPSGVCFVTALIRYSGDYYGHMVRSSLHYREQYILSYLHVAQMGTQYNQCRRDNSSSVPLHTLEHTRAHMSTHTHVHTHTLVHTHTHRRGILNLRDTIYIRRTYSVEPHTLNTQCRHSTQNSHNLFTFTGF